MTEHIDTTPPLGHRVVHRGYDCTLYYFPNGVFEGDPAVVSYFVGDMDELLVMKDFIKVNCGPDAVGNMSYSFIPASFVTEINLDPHYEYEPVEQDDEAPFHIPF